MSKPYGGEVRPIDHADGILVKLGPSTPRDAVIREVAQQVAGILLSEVDEDDDELMQELAHDAGHDFPIHVEEYRQVRRLIRDAHIVLPSEES